MAENVMLIPNEKSFVLSKVKLVKDGGLDVHYEVTEVSGNESYTNKYHVESAKDIHPDLRKCFERLRPIMGRIFESTDFKANKKQQEFARDYADEVLKNIEVRGVSLSGQDDNVGVILTGLYTVSNNMKTAINSPRIKLSSVSFGFEEELEDILSEIESEVYLFLFKGKRAQLSLFGEDGEPTPEADAETYQADDTEPEEEDDDTEEEYQK